MKLFVILKYRRKIKTISYKKLWDLLIDRDMKKKDLMTLAGISQSFIIKMGHNDRVNTEVLVKISLAHNRDIGDRNYFARGASVIGGK